MSALEPRKSPDSHCNDRILELVASSDSFEFDEQKNLALYHFYHSAVPPTKPSASVRGKEGIYKNFQFAYQLNIEKIFFLKVPFYFLNFSKRGLDSLSDVCLSKCGPLSVPFLSPNESLSSKILLLPLSKTDILIQMLDI